MKQIPLEHYLVPSIIEWFGDYQQTPYALVDTKHKLVKVPTDYIDNNGLIILNLSVNSVHDFHIDKEAMSFSASFKGTKHDIFVPLCAIIAIYSKETGFGMAINSLLSFDESDSIQIESPVKPMLKIVK